MPPIMPPAIAQSTIWSNGDRYFRGPVCALFAFFI